MPAKKENVSLEGFEELWEVDKSSENISKQIQAILKVLVDERIELNNEHQLVCELKEHINTLDGKIQRLNWQLGQREKELADLHTSHNKMKSERDSIEKHSSEHNELVKENYEIRRLTNELSNQIMQEKAKNEMLVEVLRELKQPEIKRIEEKIGI